MRVRRGLPIAFALAAVACSSRTSAQGVDVIALGDQTFHDTCARCHGPDGTGGLSMPAFATVLSDLQVRP